MAILQRSPRSLLSLLTSASKPLGAGSLVNSGEDCTLKQEERELRNSYALSQGSLDRAKTLEAKLIAIVEEIAELERALPAKITHPS
jgi:hypothetical protein